MYFPLHIPTHRDIYNKVYITLHSPQTPYPSSTLPILDPNSSGGRFQARNSLTTSSCLEHEGSETEDTSQSGAREGGGLAGTGKDGGLGGGRAGVRAGGVGDGDGRVLGGEGGRGLVAGSGLVFVLLWLLGEREWTYQPLQTTDETTVTGRVTVQGPVMVRVVGWRSR